MKKTLAAFLTAFALSTLAACGGKASAAGVYEIDKAAFKQNMLAAAANSKEKAPPEMVDMVVNGINISIELKADGSATMTNKSEMMGQKMNDVATGTWKLDGSKLTMTTKDKGGKEETKVADYANGSFSIEEDAGGQKMKMTFKKK